jgi:hypothetical protein
MTSAQSLEASSMVTTIKIAASKFSRQPALNILQRLYVLAGFCTSTAHCRSDKELVSWLEIALERPSYQLIVSQGIRL